MNQINNIGIVTTEKLYLCQKHDLVAGSGICVLVGEEQIAIFYLPEESPCIYGISNWDPIGNANVLSRGIVGDVNGELVVASPLYKQHFKLLCGQCLEVEDIRVSTYNIVMDSREVFLLL